MNSILKTAVVPSLLANLLFLAGCAEFKTILFLQVKAILLPQ